MERFREYVGWGAIILSALYFIPVPLPVLPPMLTASVPVAGPRVFGQILLMLYPMLLFAAGIGLVKGLGRRQETVRRLVRVRGSRCHREPEIQPGLRGRSTCWSSPDACS